MKKSLIVFLFSMNVLFLFAQKQPYAQIHAYYRETLPGAIPREVVDENGNSVTHSKKRQGTYFIYFSHHAHYKVKPSAIWIDGKAYKFTSDAIQSTPVVLNNPSPNGEKAIDTLVPKTQKKVVKIIPQGELTIKPPASAAKKIKSNQLVIEYSYNGKKYFSEIKEIKRLPSLALQ